MVVTNTELDSRQDGRGREQQPRSDRRPTAATSFVISGNAPGSLNEPVMEIGAGSAPIVKCLASVLTW
jgi:hypothetical protein